MPRLKGRQSKMGLPVILMLIFVAIGVLIPLKYMGVTGYRLDAHQSKTPSTDNTSKEPALSQQDAVDSIDGIKR